MVPQKNAVSVRLVFPLLALGFRLCIFLRHVLPGICCRVLRCIFCMRLPCCLVSCRRLDQLLLGGLLLWPACRTNGRTAFLLAVFVCCVCSLLGFVGVGLRVYLAWLLPRCAWANAPRARLVIAGWWWCVMSGLPRCVGFVIGMFMPAL